MIEEEEKSREARAVYIYQVNISSVNPLSDPATTDIRKLIYWLDKHSPHWPLGEIYKSSSGENENQRPSLIGRG